ncbi:unnamed protein product [Macrosiphum euphorbiae]|uniref:Gag-like protein n=1 Tax=Macrosiphum euphorbiae TaxID=13131 RepID=A0AAV0Y247_9HEMI|nr:unnamed protein product [Macrosiphum euphorbiae]
MDTESNNRSGDMGASGSQKRGPPSPGGQVAKQPRTKESNEMSDLIGWIEQTVIQEKDKKKIGVQVVEKMLTKINRLRSVTQRLAQENHRLAGELKGKDEALQQSLTVFIDKLDAKNAETSGLRAELNVLKSTSEAPRPVTTQQPTYASKTARTVPNKEPRTVAVPDATSVPPAKSNRAAERFRADKSRKVKATSRFLIEIAEDTTVASAKAEIWQSVRAKCKNPKAKTIVSGITLIIIPDDANTLEVMRGIDNVLELGPKKPRVIIYDVDGGVTKEELTECLLVQNSELGITAEDVENTTPLHKLGPRNSDVVHWVVEVPPGVLAKIENKSIYIGMTRCRCKVHSSLPQCFNCQQYGHTVIRCEQKSPTCRNCAGSHDSRECKEDMVKCANCKGPHKASNGTCRARTQATRSLLRRTDFGSK